MSSAAKSLVFRFVLLVRDASSCEVNMVIWKCDQCGSRGGYASQWIDGLDRFVGSPGFSNPVVPLGYKRNTAGI